MSACRLLSPETDWLVWLRDEAYWPSDLTTTQSNPSILTSGFSAQWIIQGEQAVATSNSVVHIFINLLQMVASEEEQDGTKVLTSAESESPEEQGTEAAALKSSWLTF